MKSREVTVGFFAVMVLLVNLLSRRGGKLTAEGVPFAEHLEDGHVEASVPC